MMKNKFVYGFFLCMFLILSFFNTKNKQTEERQKSPSLLLCVFLTKITYFIIFQQIFLIKDDKALKKIAKTENLEV
jgi:hypothetical protein